MLRHEKLLREDKRHEAPERDTESRRAPEPAGAGWEESARILSGLQFQMYSVTDGRVTEPDSVKRIAHDGARGSSPLPHLDQVQPAFGGHDLSNVKATVGGDASRACEDIGAESYASGDRVAFKGQPTPWLVAHEAAHVVQQREGVTVPGGLGKAGDVHEANADRVADRVASGQSAGDLLGGGVGRAGGGAQVQCYEAKKIEGRTAKVSDDGQAALVDRQELYAAQSLVDDANTKLETAGKDGSFIHLKTSGGLDLGSKKLKRVKPTWVAKGGKDGKHKGVSDANKKGGKDTGGGKGGEMALWTDCGKSSAAVTGSKGGDRQIVYNDKDGKQVTSSGKSNDGSVSDWLDTEPGGMANQVYWELIPPFIRDKANEGFLKEGTHYTVVSGAKQYKDPATIVEAKEMYAALTAKGKLKFDKQAGINMYANPNVGESYSMATEGDMPGYHDKGDAWNYHWAGVIMKAGDGDNVTLENYAVTEETAKDYGVDQGMFIDRDWNFAMYGAPKSDGTVKDKQTFHEQHLDTGTHGSHATSIRVKTDD